MLLGQRAPLVGLRPLQSSTRTAAQTRPSRVPAVRVQAVGDFFDKIKKSVGGGSGKQGGQAGSGNEDAARRALQVSQRSLQGWDPSLVQQSSAGANSSSACRTSKPAVCVCLWATGHLQQSEKVRQLLWARDRET
jgi:hypothetical protein